MITDSQFKFEWVFLNVIQSQPLLMKVSVYLIQEMSQGIDGNV